ncbi:sensor histidine kinase [Timonella sp. A28]|uniref:sensor histidine kinase n=1 Tax=Timonella sp. A28 TaxID=3442640 RepID=UPI003EBF21FA
MAVSKSGLSVRSRLLVGMIVLVTVVLAAASVTLYVLQHRAMVTRIDDSLKHSVRSFNVLVNSGVDPRTGEPFASTVDLMYVALQSTLPDTNEGMIATLGNTTRWTAPDGAEVRLEDDPEFLSWAVNSALATDAVYLRTVHTTSTSYRAVVLRARIASSNDIGRVVFAYDLDAERSELNATFLPFVWVSSGLLALAAVCAWFIVGRLLRPVSVLRETAQHITETDLTRRIAVSGTDDLAELSRTFNSMLDRVEAAVDSNKRLVDDVGHELRTPVTIIRGNLELLDPTDVDDVRTTREIALDELDRMSVLISDLLLLAKSDHNDFLRLAPVHVDDVVDEVAVKAELLGDRVWVRRGSSQAVVLADKQRLTQALLQLCENAVKYSQPGSTVTLELDHTDNHVVISVIDEGIGVSEDDQTHIFARFVRGTNVSGITGSGLGLAIVSAIVDAHDGALSVSSTPGEGSAFSVSLKPLHDGDAVGLDARTS